MARVTIRKEFRFEASHVLPRHPGKCARLHGHSWRLTIAVAGEIDAESGFVCDFFDLKKVVDEHVISHLDHTHLGQHKGGYAPEGEHPIWFKPYFGWDFYPSSENLVVAIARILQPFIKEIRNGVTLQEVRLSETCTSEAIWTANGDGAV